MIRRSSCSAASRKAPLSNSERSLVIMRPRSVLSEANSLPENWIRSTLTTYPSLTSTATSIRPSSAPGAVVTVTAASG